MIGKLSTRLFSTVKQHVPPKKLYGIPGRYAEAIYIAASKINSLDRVESELLSFNEVIKKNPSFAVYLKNPTVPRQEKLNIIGDVFNEEKFTHVTRNLFLTLSANGRLSEADKVISSYLDLMNTAKGVVKAVIISSEKLSKKTLDLVKDAVVKLAGEGKTLELSVVVDEKIIGGLQVLVGDKFIDLSIASRVAELSKSLEGVV